VVWAARRVLSDFTETQFFANELASIGVILGVSIAFVLNPALPSYGSNLVPHIIFAQALTSAIGVVVWRRWYRNGGWAPTYVSLVSVAPAAVLTFNGSWLSIVGGAVLGAVLAPPVARTISARLPKDFHPFIGNTLSMAISTAIVLPTLGVLSSFIG
jgi:phosphotransferase system  glucose/maltose/N-acetylglucosamine-specific IIC component